MRQGLSHRTQRSGTRPSFASSARPGRALARSFAADRHGNRDQLLPRISCVAQLRRRSIVLMKVTSRHIPIMALETWPRLRDQRDGEAIEHYETAARLRNTRVTSRSKRRVTALSEMGMASCYAPVLDPGYSYVAANRNSTSVYAPPRCGGSRRFPDGCAPSLNRGYRRGE